MSEFFCDCDGCLNGDGICFAEVSPGPGKQLQTREGRVARVLALLRAENARSAHYARKSAQRRQEQNR